MKAEPASTSPRRRVVIAAATGPLLAMVVLTAVNRGTVAFWLETGRCPGGPMDRPEVDCNVLEMLQIAALGGWLGWLLAVATLAWWALCLVVLAVGGRARDR